MAQHQNISFDFRAFRQAMLDGILETLILGPNENDVPVFKRSQTDKGRRWIKGSEVCELLNISSDELKALRVNGVISFKRRLGGYLYDYRSIVGLIPAEQEQAAGWDEPADEENDADFSADRA